MALQNISGGLFYPEVYEAAGCMTSFNTGFPPGTSRFALTATGDRICFVFNPPKAGDIKKVGFLIGSITAGQNIDVSIQDVQTGSTPPNGANGTAHSTTVTHTPVAWTWGLVTLTSNITVAPGTLQAVNFQYTSTAGTSVEIVTQGFPTSRGFVGNQYAAKSTNSGSTWTAGTGAVGGLPHMYLEYSDGSTAFLPDILPCTNNSGNTAEGIGYKAFATGSGSTPNEVGNKFQVPFSCKVGALYYAGDMDGPADIAIYDNSSAGVGAILDSGNAKVSIVAGTRPANGTRLYYLQLPNPVTLTINTVYNVTIRPTDTTVSNTAVGYFDVSAAGVLDQMSGGQNCHYIQRNSTGVAFTPTTTSRAFVGVVITALDDGVQTGGGLKTHPGMAAGMRG